MPQLGLIPILLRETLTSRRFPRQPEPDLIMEGPEQTAAFAEAGRIDGVMAATYLFNSARISQTILGARRVLDLGCGPATQLAQVAQLNPEAQFVGVDLSSNMLAAAELHVANLGLRNVEFARADIARLDGIADGSQDAVISTLALHHLPSLDLLDACFAQIQRVLRPGGAICLIDLGRLKSLKSVLEFAYVNERHQPEIFSLDFERSLRAAFDAAEFAQACARHLPQCRVYCTAGIRILIAAKTPDRGLSTDARQRLQRMRKELPPRYRRDLDDMRLFFRLGGLGGDPFA